MRPQRVSINDNFNMCLKFKDHGTKCLNRKRRPEPPVGRTDLSVAVVCFFPARVSFFAVISIRATVARHACRRPQLAVPNDSRY